MAQWVVAGGPAEAAASLPAIRPDAFRPKLPQIDAAEEEELLKSIRRDPNHKLPRTLDSKHANAANDGERTAPHTCQ